MAKRIAILGSGASGLTAIKCCLDEQLEPVCLERTNELGGLWNFKEDVRKDQGCVMRSTVINTSKEMMCYSDFPIAKEYPNFMHNTQVWKYFNEYADAFGLRKYIQYNKEVKSVKKADDFESTGRWDVLVLDHKTGSEETLTFDGVLVCTGHHASKNLPNFAGQEDFQGKIIHSQDYKDSKGYEGKRVVIVGIGNSGIDAAVEISRCGQAFVSTRRGAWVINRISDRGLPIDYHRLTRMLNLVRKVIPPEYISSMAEWQANNRMDHKVYSLQPKHRIMAQHPSINDDLANRIATGSVKIKTDVKRFTKTGVEFIDGTVEDRIDIIILATGFIFGFPFIDKSVVDVQKNKVQLYKYMFPPDLSKQTLAVIGCFQPLGAIMPIVEMQCRLATRVFKGESTLPSNYEMWKDIRMKEAKMSKTYVESQRHTIQVDYINFMDELAELVGCAPDMRQIFLSNPKLWSACMFGPCTPYQFRLSGPGVWKGAKEAIMTQEDRMKFPLKTRPLPEGMSDQPAHRLLTIIIVVVMLAILYQIFF